MGIEHGSLKEERLVSFILGVGVWLSGALFVIGLLLIAFFPKDFPSGAPQWRSLVIEVLHGNGQAWILLGIAALVATPYVRVAGLMLAYAHRKQWALFAISATVFGLLALGVYLGFGRS